MDFIIKLSTLPKACLEELSASKRSMSHFSIFLSRSSKSYNSLEMILTLYPKSNMAWCDSFLTSISIFWDPHIPNLWWYHRLIIISLYLFLYDMIGYVRSKTSLLNIERRIISKTLQDINKFIQILHLSRSIRGSFILLLSIFTSSTCLSYSSYVY
jgi:hypothetical protein